MNNIINSIKLDYYILKSSDFRRIGLVGVIAIFVGAVSKNPPLILGLIMTISGFFMSTIFAVVEKNNLNKLYGILPVKKQETVIGRYLFALLAGAVIAAVAAILTFAVAFVLNIAVGGFIFAVWLFGSFLVFCGAVSVQFPLYFKYDFSKMAAFANLPYVLIILAGAFSVRKDPELFGQTAKFFIQNPYMVGVVGIALCLLLLAASMTISIGLYKNRELLISKKPSRMESCSKNIQ